MKLVTLGIISILLSACVSKKELYSGCYEHKEERLIVYDRIQLNKDHSYNYLAEGDMHKYNLSGKWHINHHTLILNSNVQPQTKGGYKETIEGSAGSDSTASVQLILYDIFDQPLNSQKHVYIKQNADYFAPESQEGNKYVFDKKAVKSAFIIGVGSFYKELSIKLDNNANRVIAYLVPDTKGFFQSNTKFHIVNDSTFITKNFAFSKVDCSR